jgi:hypothetical protein
MSREDHYQRQEPPKRNNSINREKTAIVENLHIMIERFTEEVSTGKERSTEVSATASTKPTAINTREEYHYQ